MTDTNDSGLPKPPRVEVTAAWLAEQRAKQLAYQVERAKWTAALDTVREHPEAIVCRCKKCRKWAADQMRLPL